MVSEAGKKHHYIVISIVNGGQLSLFSGTVSALDFFVILNFDVAEVSLSKQYKKGTKLNKKHPLKFTPLTFTICFFFFAGLSAVPSGARFRVLGTFTGLGGLGAFGGLGGFCSFTGFSSLGSFSQLSEESFDFPGLIRERGLVGGVNGAACGRQAQLL